MKSKRRKRVIASVLCMVLMLSTGMSTLAEADAGTVPAVEETTAAQTTAQETKSTSTDAQTAETETQTQTETENQTETKQTEEAAQTKQEETTAVQPTEEASGGETTQTETDQTAQNTQDQTTSAETSGTETQNETVETQTEETETTTQTEETQETKEEASVSPAFNETYENSEVTVKVTADEGIVPEGAELSVTPIVKKEITDQMSEEEKAEAKKINDQYDLTEKKLSEDSDKNKEIMEGFLAYDISFLVDGKEVEPSGDVKVVIDFKKAAAPEGVSEDATVEVKHLKEDPTAEDGVVVENMDEKATVKTTEKAEVEKVELLSDSFSIYTINWRYGYSGSLEIQIVDENGNSIGNNGEINLSENQTTVKAIAEQIVVPSGYQFKEAKYGKNFQNANTKVTGLRIEYERFSGRKNQYKNEENQWNDIENGYYIYFIFERTTSGAIEIVDHISTNGLLETQISNELQAQIDAAAQNGEEVRFVWLKSENGSGFEEVELKKSGSNYNITNDGKALDVIIDEADKAKNTKYKVAVYIGEAENPSATSEEFVIPYYTKIQNGSFEEPVSDGQKNYRDHGPSSKNSAQWSNENYKYQGGVWQTTGVGTGAEDDQDIEVLHMDGQGGNTGFMNGSDRWEKKAADGDQYAEINCETSGALYQDVLTDTNADLNYYLSHRARSRTNEGDEVEKKFDTMYLVIMPTEKAENYTTHSRLVNELNKLVPGENIPVDSTPNTSKKEEKTIIYNQDGILIARITSNAEDWESISSDNIECANGVTSKTYRPTSSLSRFFFISGATAAGAATDEPGNTIGNLVDYIGFGQDPVPPDAGEVKIEIKKTVSGLTETQFNLLKEKLKFKITTQESGAPLNGATVPASELQWKTSQESDGTFKATGSKTLTGTIASTNWDNTYTYSVMETGAEVEGTELETTIQIHVSGGTLNGNNAILGEQDAATFEFTNEYTPAYKLEPVNFFLNLSSKILDSDGNIQGQDNDFFTTSVSGSFTDDDNTELGVGEPLNTDLMVKLPSDHDHESINSPLGVIGSDSIENAVEADQEIRKLKEGTMGNQPGQEDKFYQIVGGNGTGAFPTDAEVFKYIRDNWGTEEGEGVNKGQDITVNGTPIDPANLTTANFAIRWYVFKDQKGSDYWHIDGILVPKSGILTITKTFDSEEIAENVKDKFEIQVKGDFLDEPEETISYKLENGEMTSGSDGKVTYTWSVAVFGESYEVKEVGYRTTDAIHWKYQTTTCKYEDAKGTVDTSYDMANGKTISIPTERGSSDTDVRTEQRLDVTNHYYKTVDLDLIKISAGTSDPIDGAQFKLSRKEMPSGEWIEIQTSVTVDNGNQLKELNNLEPGYIYQLEETKAPNSHALLDEKIYFKIVDGKAELCDETGEGIEANDIEMWELSDDGLTLTIKNHILYELPSAGGPGTFGYTIGGVLLLMAGTLILYKLKKGEVLKK